MDLKRCGSNQSIIALANSHSTAVTPGKGKEQTALQRKLDKRLEMKYNAKELLGK